MLTVGHRLRETELALGVLVRGSGTFMPIAVVPITEGAAQKRLLVLDRGGERDDEIQSDHDGSRTLFDATASPAPMMVDPT